MTLISRKIFLDLLKIFLITLVIMVFLLSLIQINNLFALGINSADLYLKAWEAALYLVPQLFFIISPMALFISGIILLSDYRKNKIILALQSLGFSDFQIQKPFLLLAGFLVFSNYLILFTILPSSKEKFKFLQKTIKEENVSKFLEVKTLKEINKDLFFYLENKKDDQLEGIFLLDNRGENNKVFSAEKGQLYKGALQLEKGFYQEIADNKVKITASFDSYQVVLEQEAIKQRLELYELSIYQLYNYSGPDKGRADFFFHQKLALPLYSIFCLILLLKVEWTFNYSRNFSRQDSSKALFWSLSLFFITNLIVFFLETIQARNFSKIAVYFVGPSLLQLFTWVIKFKQKRCSQ